MVGTIWLGSVALFCPLQSSQWGRRREGEEKEEKVSRVSKRTEERERKLGGGVKNSLQGRPSILDSCGWC